MANAYRIPYVDDNDNEPEGENPLHEALLSDIRGDAVPGEVKLRRVNRLETEVFPFWRHCSELDKQEAEELMEVFLKYNGPNGIRERSSHEYDRIKRRIATSGDAIILESMDRHNPDPISRPGRRSFAYGSQGSILYDIVQDPEDNPGGDDRQSAQANHGPTRQRHNVNPNDELPVSSPIAPLLKALNNHVWNLRNRQASKDPAPGQGQLEVPIEGGAQLDGQSRKRPREDNEDASDDGESRGPKRHRPLRSGSAGPSTSNAMSPRAAAAKRPPAPTEDDGADEDAEAYEGRVTRAAKRQRLMSAASSFSVPRMDSGAAIPGPSAAAPRQAAPPLRAARKRARPAVNDDGEGDDQEPGDSPGPAAAKRRRGMQGPPPPARLPVASPEAGPSTPRRPPHEPAVPGTGSSHATSLAGQFTPEPVRFPSQYREPSSESLNFSRQTIEMGKIVKMGKKRPWLFGYNTPKGYGIFAFVNCRGRDCKHHFSSHPLEDGRAYDHFLSCDQPIRDTRYMVKEYAYQVVKEEGRKSNLTVEWARKSNLHLLPSDLHHNHPENFPLSP